MPLRKVIAASIVIGLVALAPGCHSEEPPASRAGTVYSCDNPQFISSGSAPCFPSDDPKYMTVALRAAPADFAGSARRLEDSGTGLAVVVLDEREKSGTTWYKVDSNGTVGWIAEHLIFLEPSAD
jgi:hypothetical protein